MVPVVAIVFNPWWGIAVIAFGMLYIWLVATASATTKQRNEARHKIHELTDVPPISVKAVTGKRRADYERTQHLMWADLQITNNSTSELKDVQVSVERCLGLGNDPTKKNGLIMWDQYNIKPFSVYWAETQTQPKQMKLDIPKGATRSALIAFQNNSNGGQFNFNSLNREWIATEVKIDIEISSNVTILWTGSFYIECRPNYAGKTIPEYDPARFEFVEWDKYINNRSVTLLDY